MARRPAWLAGAAALTGLVLYRVRAWRRWRERTSAATTEGEAHGDPRADELRRKLDESRPLVEERDEFEGAETTVDQAEPSAPRLHVDERRREIHDEGRATVESMRTPSPEEEQGPVHDA